MSVLSEHDVFLFLIQLFIILLAARGLGELFRKWNQPSLTAELLVGIVLGPTILGRFFPGISGILFPEGHQSIMIETVAWIGVFFLLLETGLEMDFSSAWRRRGSAMLIAFADIFIPMLVAFIPCMLMPARFLVDPGQRVIFSLFMATVMTISAMPVSARVLRDLNLLKTDLGFLTMSALAVNDIFGWVIFTIVLGIFSTGVFAPGPVFAVFFVTIAFTVLALGFGRKISTNLLGFLHNRGLPEPGVSLTFVLLLGLLFGAFTQRIGIHALFGFFIAGIVVGEAKNMSEETRRIISQMVHALFVPVFFVNIGLKTDFVAYFNLPVIVFLCVIGMAGRYFGAWFGVTFSRATNMNRDLIAIAHTPGGMMEIVVALLAFQNGLITSTIFVAIIFSAVFSSIVLGPWMSWSLARRKKVSVVDYLPPTSVLARLKAANRDEAIDQLAHITTERLARVADAEQVKQAVLAREDEFGTGIGGGVAIPHTRLYGLSAPVLAFAHTTDGVDWNAPDGVPARFIFFLVTPDDAHDIHVQILSQIAKALQTPGALEQLNEFESPDDIYDYLKQLFAAPPSKTKSRLFSRA